MRELLTRLRNPARDSSRLAVRPTGRGWQALLFGVLSLVVAYLVGTTQIYQLAYALFALLFASLILGYVLSRGLGYARSIPRGERLVAGRESRLDLLITNVSRPGSPRVEVVDRLPEPRRFVVPPVEGGGTREIRVRVGFPKRGLYELGPAEVRTGDPFGLLRFSRRFEGREEVVVYPEVFELPGFPLPGRGTDSGARGSFAHGGDEFSGLREYRRGDDRRHIHWKSVARTGELMVREFSANAPRRHAVVLDLHRAGIRVPEAEVESAVSAAGSILARLADEGLPFGLLCADKARNTTGFGSGEAHLWGAMRILATAQADGKRKPGTFLEEAPREELGEGVILVSRTLDDGLVNAVGRLRAAGLPVVVVAIAAHTYRGSHGGAGGRAARMPGGREAAHAGEIRRLELAGALVRVVRHPEGVAALAGVRRKGAARSARGVV